MAGLKALDNFEIFDVEGFLKGKELVMVSCEKNYNKMDNAEYEVFDFNTKERKKQKGVNFRKSFILFIDKPELEPEKFDDFSVGEKVMIKGLKPSETMHFGSNLIVVADDLVKLERKQPQQ